MPGCYKLSWRASDFKESPSLAQSAEVGRAGEKKWEMAVQVLAGAQLPEDPS